MKYSYEITAFEYKETKDLPGAWTVDNLRSLLKEIDFDDWDTTPENELLDMLIMALDEMGVDEAGEAVFKFIMNDEMSSGQIKNSVHKLQEENLWEYYAEIDLHSKMFEVAWLLSRVFSGTYDKPVFITLKMTVKGTPEALDVLESKLGKGNILRLIASGMSEDYIINRLYGDQLKKDRFPDAEGLIWQWSKTRGADSLELEVLSSEYWMNDLEEVEGIAAEL